MHMACYLLSLGLSMALIWHLAHEAILLDRIAIAIYLYLQSKFLLSSMKSHAVATCS